MGSSCAVCFIASLEAASETEPFSPSLLSSSGLFFGSPFLSFLARHSPFSRPLTHSLTLSLAALSFLQIARIERQSYSSRLLYLSLSCFSRSPSILQ